MRLNIINISETGEKQNSGFSSGGTRKGKGIARSRDGSRAANEDSRALRPVPCWLSEESAEVLSSYIVPVNAALCGILAVGELWKGRDWAEGFVVGGGHLPGLIFVIVLWARRELRVVDLGDLERLRFRTKGN